jgi:hypothetical protein
LNPIPRPKQAERAKEATGAKAAKRKVRSGRKPGSALEREVHRLRQARGRLERRLTEAVQEIGMLRQFETRVQALQAEVGRRDAEIAELRRERDERSRKSGSLLREGSIPTTPS